MFHSSANGLAVLLMKLLFASVARVRVLRRENANRPGGLLLAANHISHFDRLSFHRWYDAKSIGWPIAEFSPLPLLGRSKSRFEDLFGAAHQVK